jgi:hypothetical protein
MASRVIRRPVLQSANIQSVCPLATTRGMRMLHPPKFENEPFVSDNIYGNIY